MTSTARRADVRTFSTSLLLTCAAIGVAGGALLIAANLVSTVLFAVAPLWSVAIAGLWLLPAVIALRLLQRPGVGLLVGLISGLVAVPFTGTGFGAVATNVWWAFFAEVGFLLVAYRFWTIWNHLAGAVVVTAVYPVLAAVSFELDKMSAPAIIGFVALLLASSIAATLLGVVIGDRLRAMGLARASRRRH